MQAFGMKIFWSFMFGRSVDLVNFCVFGSPKFLKYLFTFCLMSSTFTLQGLYHALNTLCLENDHPWDFATPIEHAIASGSQSVDLCLPWSGCIMHIEFQGENAIARIENPWARAVAIMNECHESMTNKEIPIAEPRNPFAEIAAIMNESHRFMVQRACTMM